MIPDDIREKAIAAFDEAMKFNTDHESEGVIAEAILAERQRCADTCLKLADHQEARGQYREAYTSRFIGQQLTAGTHAITP